MTRPTFCRRIVRPFMNPDVADGPGCWGVPDAWQHGGLPRSPRRQGRRVRARMRQERLAVQRDEPRPPPAVACLGMRDDRRPLSPSLFQPVVPRRESRDPRRLHPTRSCAACPGGSVPRGGGRGAKGGARPVCPRPSSCPASARAPARHKGRRRRPRLRQGCPSHCGSTPVGFDASLIACFPQRRRHGRRARQHSPPTTRRRGTPATCEGEPQ
jgi:hypothetical protein